jgi:hypothetical protein
MFNCALNCGHGSTVVPQGELREGAIYGPASAGAFIEYYARTLKIKLAREKIESVRPSKQASKQASKLNT